MERFSNAIFLFVFALSATLGKNLHVKEYHIQKNTGDQPQGFNFNIYDSYNTSHNERYVRHLKVEAVTETVVSHLFNEIKNRYPRTGNDTILRKMMKNLRSRLKMYVHKQKQQRTKKTRNSTETLKYV